MKRLAAADRSALIRLARSIPLGDEVRKVVLAGLKRATDQQEVADVLGSALKKGQSYTYDELAALARKEAGSDVSTYMEAAISILVEDGALTKSGKGYKAT